MKKKQNPTPWGDVPQQPIWISCYSDSMHRARTPGWLILAVVVSHLACCTHLVPQPSGLSRHISNVNRMWFSSKKVTKEEEPIVQETQPTQESEVVSPNNDDWTEWIWNVVSTDPMTNIIEAATRIVSTQPSEQLDEKKTQWEDTGSCKAKTPPSTPTTEKPTKQAAVGGHGPGLHDVTEFMGLAAVCFFTVWIPGTYRAMPTGPDGVWILGAVGTLCITIGAGICCIGCEWNFTRRAAVCASMHLASQHIMSIWNVCRTSPSSPFHGHGAGIQQAVCALFIAAILFRVSHGTPEGMGDFDELQFYTSHAWAIACVEMIRAFVHAPVVFLLLGRS